MPQKDAPASDTEPPGASGDAEAAVHTDETFVSLGYIDCLQYCLQQRDRLYPKALLMGVSGESFRLCYDRNDPERGLQVVSHNPLRAACAALGYDADVVYHRELEHAVTGLAEDLAARGCAIVHTEVDWVVVQPDAADPARVLARLPDGRSQAWQLSHLKQTWLREPGLLELGLEGYYHFVVGDKEREPDEREAAMASLRRGVRLLMRRSRIDGCAAGIAAYEEVADSLLRKQRGEERQARTVQKYALWNALPLCYIRDSRRSAASYLTMIQAHFDEQEAREHLQKAADAYRQAVQALSDLPMLDHAFADPEAAQARRTRRKAIRNFSFLRRRAAGRMRRARRAEEEALLEIRRALEAAERKDKE